MNEWRIEVSESRVSAKGAPGVHVDIFRDDQRVAAIYPTNNPPGLQIVSDRLDFAEANVAFPDSDGGQTIHVATIRPVRAIASASVPGRWLALQLQEEDQ